MNDLEPKPEDDIYNSLKIAIAALASSVAGEPFTLISTFFTTIFSHPMEKRMKELLVNISTDLAKLKEQVGDFDLDSLPENEIFVSTIARAGQIATRNHQEEKLIALRNAVLNTAAGLSPEESLQQMFMELIDTLTPWHMRLLNFFNEGVAWQHLDNLDTHRPLPVALLRVIHKEFPELSDLYDLENQLMRDLEARSLIYDVPVSKVEADLGVDGFIVRVKTRQGQLITETIKHRGNYGELNRPGFIHVTTGLGKQFIQFITSPIGES